jgi:hypothetical protein
MLSNTLTDQINQMLQSLYINESSEDIIIPNITNYTYKIRNNILYLSPIPSKIYISESELAQLSLTSSNIIFCDIKDRSLNVITNKVKYNKILIDIWKQMLINNILQNTTFNFKLSDEKGYKGYIYNSDLKVSYQRKDANNTFTEIINMIKYNRFNIDISIKLKNNDIIHFKII